MVQILTIKAIRSTYDKKVRGISNNSIGYPFSYFYLNFLYATARLKPAIAATISKPGVGVGVGVGVAVAAGVAVITGVSVALAAGVAVTCAVAFGTVVAVAVAVAVAVGVTVGVGLTTFIIRG